MLCVAGPQVVTDPAYHVTRNMEDFVTWVDTSKIRQKVFFFSLSILGAPPPRCTRGSVYSQPTLLTHPRLGRHGLRRRRCRNDVTLSVPKPWRDSPRRWLWEPRPRASHWRWQSGDSDAAATKRVTPFRDAAGHEVQRHPRRLRPAPGLANARRPPAIAAGSAGRASRPGLADAWPGRPYVAGSDVRHALKPSGSGNAGQWRVGGAAIAPASRGSRRRPVGPEPKSCAGRRRGSLVPRSRRVGALAPRRVLSDQNGMDSEDRRRPVGVALRRGPGLGQPARIVREGGVRSLAKRRAAVLPFHLEVNRGWFRQAPALMIPWERYAAEPPPEPVGFGPGAARAAAVSRVASPGRSAPPSRPLVWKRFRRHWQASQQARAWKE